MPEIIPNLHPVFVHFTVALFSISSLLFIAIMLFRKQVPEKLSAQLLIVARWNLWLGAAITLITIAAGIFAYNTVFHDGPSHAAMTIHRNWALTTLPFYLGVAIWAALQAKSGKCISQLFVGAVLVTQLLLLSTAWHGGELVYRYGLGVISLPTVQGDGHAHEHEGNSDHGHPEVPASNASADLEMEDMDMSDMEMFPSEASDGHTGHTH